MEYLDGINKKTVLLFGLVAVVTALGIFVWWYGQRDFVIANEFAGRIKEMNGGGMLLEGAYIVPDRPELSAPSKYREVRIVLTPETKFVKILVFLPHPDELGPDRYFNTNDLRKETVEAIADDLRQDMWVSVKSSDNIFGKKKFKASEIIYTEEVPPVF